MFAYPLVSIIIPVYNVKPFLNECIKSVINQTYKNLEILLIDDGSTDGSDIICDYYRSIDARITVIHQNNKGLSGARNTGLNLMRGKYVAFLDSDDAYMPDAIKQLIKKAIKAHADIVTCGYYYCKTVSRLKTTKHTRIVSFENKAVSSKMALNMMLDGRINVTVWNKLYCSKLFDNLRFVEGRVYEDLLLMPYIFERATSIQVIDSPLILYRRHPESITTTFSEKNMLDMLYARQCLEAFVIKRTPSIYTVKKKELHMEGCLQNIISLKD